MAESSETQTNPPFAVPANLNPQEYRVSEKRQRNPSRKALQNAIQLTTAELSRQAKALRTAADNVFTSLREKSSTDETKLYSPTKKYEEILNELEGLYAQDKWGDMLNDAEIIRQSGRADLEYARTALNKARDIRLKESEREDRIQRKYRCSSRVSHASSRSSSSSVRTKALAEAAVARKQAEYDRLMAEKEHARRQREAEENRLREQRRAQHDRDMAILAADKVAAIADAKLAAIEMVIDEEEKSTALSKKAVSENARHRTQEWINAQEIANRTEEVNIADKQYTTPLDTPPTLRTVLQETPTSRSRPQDAKVQREECTEAILATNKQLITSLARQSLPKCHPDTFGGDATLFHPWKSAFKAMIQNANIPPDQEANYLRQYTKGGPQRLVDSYRKRQHRDPSSLLQEVWTELEKRFGNAAVITNALLKKLSSAAKFNEKEREKRQTFADICADVDSQLDFLPGLACLNYPNTIRPIAERMPHFLQSKWEKQVAHYAERNHDAYPGFHDFAVMIQKQATLKNHPNILALGTPSPNETKPTRVMNGRSTLRPDAKTFVSSAKPLPRGSTNRPNENKHCLFHDTNGHDLTCCKAFERKPLTTKTDWIMRAGLCFRCLSPEHQANACTAATNCEKCGSSLHNTLLHREKRKPDTEDNGEELKTTCTAVCHNRSGGLSCSKIVLLDAFQKDRPDLTLRVYAIIDDQSNASMISPLLADKLGSNGPKEKFLLSTCSVQKEVKYGRRVTGLVVRSIEGEETKLPTLIECDHIPRDKSEIPTPAIASKFSHLKEIAHQIPPLDANANVEILIGRDAPELLKVRAFKNGPPGAPWAQKLKLGWTVSGQVCLNRVGGPVHISAHRTAVDVSTPNWSCLDQDGCQPIASRESSPSYEIAPCPNHFVIKEEYAGGEQIAPDVYHRTEDDNEASLSQEDRRFLDVMKRTVHKNKQGNWEMPLPFRSSDVRMPNNRSQAVNRLNSLLRSFKRKPQLERDYFAFMAKILDRGHAAQVPPDELSIEEETNGEKSTNTDRRGRVWYLPHFGIYHPKKPDQVRVVFDSSAEFQGVSLNKELLPGPDQMNSLLGVLVRFRQEVVALMCDVEQMFHSFYVNPEHRDFIRFLWFKNNDPSEEIVEYRMLVHLSQVQP